MSRAAYYSEPTFRRLPTMRPHTDEEKARRTLQSLMPGQKLRRPDMISYSDFTKKHEINRLSRDSRGHGISDPPINEADPVTHDDLWWFPPVQGNILYNDNRRKFRYMGNKRRFPGTHY